MIKKCRLIIRCREVLWCGFIVSDLAFFVKTQRSIFATINYLVFSIKSSSCTWRKSVFLSNFYNYQILGRTDMLTILITDAKSNRCYFYIWRCYISVNNLVPLSRCISIHFKRPQLGKMCRSINLFPFCRWHLHLFHLHSWCHLYLAKGKWQMSNRAIPLVLMRQNCNWGPNLKCSHVWRRVSGAVYLGGALGPETVRKTTDRV